MSNTPKESWSIGCYYGSRSICVNLDFDGASYHRSDYGLSPIPRFIRLGWAIASIERESGLRSYGEQLLAMFGR